MYGRWRSASIARGEEDKMTSLFRLSDNFHSEPEWMDYWSKFWDCGDVAVGRYQHAHAASTYSYTLALSRSPSLPTLPYSFLQPSYLLVLSLPHVPFLVCSYVSPFFPLQIFCSDHYTAFCLSLSFFLSVCYLLFFPLFLKHYLSSFLFSHFLHDFSFYVSCYWKPIFSSDFLIFYPCTFIIFIDIYDATIIILLLQWHFYFRRKCRCKIVLLCRSLS